MSRQLCTVATFVTRINYITKLSSFKIIPDSAVQLAQSDDSERG